jgi:hypothetical protein
MKTVNGFNDRYQLLTGGKGVFSMMVLVKFPGRPEVACRSSAKTYRRSSQLKGTQVRHFSRVIIIEIWKSHSRIDNGIGDCRYRIG